MPAQIGHPASAFLISSPVQVGQAQVPANLGRWPSGPSGGETKIYRSQISGVEDRRGGPNVTYIRQWKNDKNKEA